MVALPARRVSACLAAGLVVTLLSASPLVAATRTVTAGGDLQAALDAAQPGDAIVLSAGARFVGTFVLPVKPAGPVITIRSSSLLPERRITPADASLLPTIASGSAMPALTCTGAANWKLDGVRFEPTLNGHSNLIEIQDCTNITIDRMLFVAPENVGQRRGIMGNGRAITLTRSHLAGIWAQTLQDSQAFCAWDGAGPYTIRDNYLEAASENVMFGGANSGSADRIPSDILVENNTLTKRLEWKGKARAVKNLFELKSARRVVIRNNVFERNWTDAQSGWAILFTVRNDEGQSPWSVIEDVLFEHNIVRDTEQGISVLGYDSYQPSGRTTRVTIRHNLVITAGNFLQVGSEVGVLTLDHNTVVQGGTFAIAYKGELWIAGERAPRPAAYAIDNLTVTNTIAAHNDYGFWGEDAGIGTSAIDGLTRSYTWTNNVIAGELGWGRVYPVITWQPSMAEHLSEFNPDYTLVAGSSYRGLATDGTDLGRLTTAVSPGGQLPPEPPPPAPVPTEPLPPEPVPTDAEGPTVTLKAIGKNPNALKNRVEASDPSGIASVKVWFNNAVLLSAATVPVDFDIPLKSLRPGSYLLVVTVMDRIGNATTLNRTIQK